MLNPSLVQPNFWMFVQGSLFICIITRSLKDENYAFFSDPDWKTSWKCILPAQMCKGTWLRDQGRIWGIPRCVACIREHLSGTRVYEAIVIVRILQFYVFFFSVLPSWNALELEMNFPQHYLQKPSKNHWSSFFVFLDLAIKRLKTPMELHDYEWKWIPTTWMKTIQSSPKIMGNSSKWPLIWLQMKRK